MLPAPPFVYVLSRNGRAQLLWEGLPGAHYNVYRNGVLVKGGLDVNLWIDFSVANGTAYTYTVSAVDANAVEGPQNAGVTVTPAMPTATQFRYRQVLGDLLHWLVETDGVPAINSAFALDAQSKGLAAPLLTLGEANVMRGARYEIDGPTLCVDVMGEMPAERFLDGLSSVVFSSQVLFLLPSAGANRPEDRAFAGDVVADNLRTLFGCQANALIPAISPKTGNWMLPGRAVFKDCHPVRVMRLNQPVRMAGGVERVPAWLFLHQTTLEISQADLMRS